MRINRNALITNNHLFSVNVFYTITWPERIPLLIYTAEIMYNILNMNYEKNPI